MAYIYVYIIRQKKISDIEVSNIRFGKLDDNLRTPSHNIAFISYERDRTPLNAITPEFITETYGVPREGPHYQADRSRAFFKMPFFATNQGSKRAR